MDLGELGVGVYPMSVRDPRPRRGRHDRQPAHHRGRDAGAVHGRRRRGRHRRRRGRPLPRLRLGRGDAGRDGRAGAALRRGGQGRVRRPDDGVHDRPTTATRCSTSPRSSSTGRSSPARSSQAWTYNGTVPAPEIHVEVGDKVRIILQNELPDRHRHPLARHPGAERDGRRAAVHAAGRDARARRSPTSSRRSSRRSASTTRTTAPARCSTACSVPSRSARCRRRPS